MEYRLSWIAGIAAVGLAFWELSSLLRETATGTSWQIAILVAALLGAGVTWTAIAYRFPAWLVILANVGAFAILTGFLIAPDTLLVVLPTAETWAALQVELRRAVEIIRYSVEPVRPVPGLVLLLAVLFWTLGFLFTAGLMNNRPFVAIITPLVVALQFSIIDRKPKSLTHVGVFILVVAFSLIAIRSDERDQGAGRLQRVNATRAPSRRPALATGLLITATVVAGLVAVGLAGDTVPTDGFATWRSPAGYSDGYSSGVAYNPFTDIRAGLISQTDNPLFTADISGADPTTIRFRTVTLDVYRNGRWATERVHAYPTDEEPWIDEAQQYRGDTISVVAEITIQNLRQPWMPAPTTPVDAVGGTSSDTASIRVRRLDGSLFLPGDVTYEGMRYTVAAEIPMYTSATLAAIARTETGELSPLFEAAVADGRSIPEPAESITSIELADLEFWIETPDDLGEGVRLRARQVTQNLTTNFEKALALEYYFRSSGEFTYNVAVPGEYTTGSVELWLTDETNPFVRNGYCEQFATAMALMARSLGVPSRVVLGFTPGTLLESTTVLVMDRNAHAWVEMWIPNYGWMAFDPTPRFGFAAQTANDSLTDLLGFSPVAYASEIPDPETLTPEGGLVGPDGRLTPREDVERQVFLGAGGSEDTSSGLSLPTWLTRVLELAAVAAVLATLVPISKWFRRRRRMNRLSRGDIASAWEDIVERLADLGEPVDPSSTALEAAESMDEALVPLARSYGDSLYGEYESTTVVIDRATSAHAMAVRGMATRYSRLERGIAVFRPTRLLAKWSRILDRTNGRH